MLDILPPSLFQNPKTTFLDPACKSGVFLREITKRLMVGLEKKIKDPQERLNHILQNQVFGLAITELTSLLTRRSVYCSKKANGKYSICTTFKNERGNIIYENISHEWVQNRCTFCGANKVSYGRETSLESHAYQFIHTEKPEEIFKMKFDVIIGNPPYQLNDGGGVGTSAKPIYHLFIAQAKKLNPNYLIMITPSRWFSGGKGLDDFRNEMLNDRRIRKIVDYFDSNECFPGVDISGGVSYFLWSKDSVNECEVINIEKSNKSVLHRPLVEKDSDSFIRFNNAVSIYRKIKKKNENSFLNIVSARKPFGIIASIKPKEKKNKDSDVKIYSYPKNGFIDPDVIKQNHEFVNLYKVFVAKAYGERGNFPYKVLAEPFIGEPQSCCSETYLLIGPSKSSMQTKNIISYIKTRFFRFLVLLRKNTQNAPRSVYKFVPMQDFSEKWTDEKLYKKYDLTKDEIDFIESMIRPMENGHEE
ncbi:MAG: Eco57I restriction-modification methylase domain-containing protein [Bdellovibrionales bacterium]|nr:Eco57I restriction-modification methylase domain-containing protein [Bdellovibrionales bacterium]